MLVWGAIWGGVLGYLWPGSWDELQFVIGAALGALSGYMLRSAIRSELRKLQVPVAAAAAKPQAAVAAPAPRATSAPAQVPVDFQDTFPQAPDLGAGAAPSQPPAAPPSPSPLPRPAPAPAAPNPVTVLLGKARDWLLGGNTVVRTGVLVLFVGLAFLAKYAIDNALLPPELRLAGIGASGIALFAVGLWLRTRAPARLAYALTLQGAGVAVLYLTVFAAFRLYQFLPSGAAFGALGLICAFSTVIALLQNAPAMAFIGFAGGFAAPILVSTGQGHHVALFSYYLLLGVAIAAIAWAKAWRSLNLLGFLATFGVATVWGALQYRPEQFGSTEPFLLAFFAVYVAAAVLYATRHSLAARKAVDATLVFGVPIVAFGLQARLVKDIEYGAAFSSLALGALYLALGWWMARRGRAGHEASRWLAECFAALGVGFATLAVPLALDARWTSAVWAIEGAGVFWMGRRQGRWLARAAGLALQLFAAGSYLSAAAGPVVAAFPLANPVFIGAVMLSAAALGIAWWTRMPVAAGDSPLARQFARLEEVVAPLLFWAGFLWWQFALDAEISRAVLDPTGVALPVIEERLGIHLRLLAWVASAFLFHLLALPRRARPWPVAATPAFTALPVMFGGALYAATRMNHVFESGGWAVWPALLALHGVMLRRLDGGRPQPWWPWVHAGGVWLLVFLAGNLLVYAIGRGGLWHTAWATVILLVAATLALLLLARRRWFAGGPQRWPFDRFARAYLWTAALPLAAGVALGCLLVAVMSDGNARPLPYVPLLNPTDLAVATGLAACALWLARLRSSALAVPPAARSMRWSLGVAGIAFVAVNTVWLRVAHHYFGVAWDAGHMFDSFLVQAGYSILWTLLALGLMIGAQRRGLRGAWMAGACLLGLTVLKLFVIDLSNRGGSERIIVFIAVGVLMLVVGYFAPLPPARKPAVADLQGVHS